MMYFLASIIYSLDKFLILHLISPIMLENVFQNTYFFYIGCQKTLSKCYEVKLADGSFMQTWVLKGMIFLTDIYMEKTQFTIWHHLAPLLAKE